MYFKAMNAVGQQEQTFLSLALLGRWLLQIEKETQAPSELNEFFASMTSKAIPV